MPDLVSIANDLKTAPDQWLAQQMQRPTGSAPPYLVLAELQRRQLLRSGSSQQKPPSSSVAQDTLQSTLKQLMPPPQTGPPPPAGMTPPSNSQQPAPGPKPPSNVPTPPMRTMADGGEYDDGEEDYTDSGNTGGGGVSIPDLVDLSAQRWNVPSAFAHSIIKTESNYRRDALSKKGAYGPGQLMPATARNLKVDPRDPAQNVDGSVHLMRMLLDKYGGDYAKASAAYNAGETQVDRYGGVPPFKETQNYVKKVSKSMKGLLASESSVPAPDPSLTGSMQNLLSSASGGVTGAIPPEEPPQSGMPAPVGPLPSVPGMASAPPPPAAGPAAAPVAPTGLAAVTVPEKADLDAARARMEGLTKNWTPYDPAGELDPDKLARRKASLQSILHPQDYGEYESAIHSWQNEIRQQLRPNISNILLQMGMSLLASHKGFGEALGEAGLATMSNVQKQQQQARRDYIDALKAGVELEDKKRAQEREMAGLVMGDVKESQTAGIQANRQHATDVREAQKEVDKAQTNFNKAVAASPQGRLEIINQGREAMGLPRVTDAKQLSDDEQKFVYYATKPKATGAENTTSLAIKAVSDPDPEVRKKAHEALRLLGKDQGDFNEYLNPGQNAPAAPAASGAPAAPGAATGPAQPATGGPFNLPLVSQPKFNESVLANLSPEEREMVKGIASYEITLPKGTAISKPEWKNRFAAAKLYNPGFDVTQYDTRLQTRKSFAPGGKDAAAIDAFNTVTEHTQRMEDNWKKLNNYGGWFTSWNTPKNWFKGKFLGDPNIARIQLNQEAEATELMKAWRQTGVGSEKEIERWREAFSTSASPEAQKAVIDEVYGLISGRLRAMKQKYETAMGEPANFHMLRPEVVDRFAAHGQKFLDIDPGYPRAGVPQAAAPAAARTATMDDVKAFAKKHNMSIEQATKAVQAEGWTIQ